MIKRKVIPANRIVQKAMEQSKWKPIVTNRKATNLAKLRIQRKITAEEYNKRFKKINFR